MSRKKLDLVGQKFGKLTCLEFIGLDRHNKRIFEFQCDCGNLIQAIGSSVKNGNTNSCGCYHKERLIKEKRFDLVGKKFNRLTCLEYVKQSDHGNSVFKFKCDCGKVIETLGTSVKKGDTKSCGCFRKERVSESSRTNLTGQKFNRLTCLEYVKTDKNRKCIFKFRCECGNIIETLGNGVKSGRTKSCGCLVKEQSSINGSNVGINNSKSANKGWCYGTTRMRSGYEIFYASILDANKIEWEYEPETFKLSNGLRYTPDFYLPETDTWVEIKGRMTFENASKIEQFRRLNGGNKLKVLFIKDLEKLAGQSYQSFMKENKEYYL